MKEKIFDLEFLKKLDNLAINVSMTMNEGALGGRKSKAKGSSVEFSDFREYSLGDDFRRIDWNAYGRFDKLFVKLFMEEREAAVNIFLDCSKSMDFGEDKKSIMSLKLAAILSFLALNNLDRVSITRFKEEGIEKSSALTGRTMFTRILEYLQQTEFSGKIDLEALMKKVNLKDKGVSILISDFFTTGDLEASIKYLVYKKQQVILLHLLSEEELNPDLNGQIRLIDSETKLAKDISVTPNILKAYHKELTRFQSSIREFSKKLGVDYLLINSSEAIEKIIFEYFSKIGFIK